MKPVNQKDKRNEIRIPLLSEKVVFLDSNKKELVADVSDITAEGLFLRTAELLKPRDTVYLKISLPGDLGQLELVSEVVRINWMKSAKRNKEHLGMGLKFKNITESQKKILDAYVVYLRNKQIISVSKRIIEEFFGPKGSK